MNKEQLRHIRICKEIYKWGKSNNTRITNTLMKRYQLLMRRILNNCVKCPYWDISSDTWFKCEKDCDKPSKNS